MRLSGGVERGRRWASCFTRSYSAVSGGHVFREPVPDRLKQFVLHKLKYHKEKFGLQMCVGCGRCITVCLASIDITKVSSGK
jgi:ferredoxin